jgi:putative GTP pyrophosphokinase
MNESEFREKFRSEMPLYEAWGKFVIAELEKKILNHYSEEIGFSLSGFFKVPIKARVKDEASLVKKAYHSNKAYKDLYADITDKVGLRIVVLLQTEIEVLCGLVEGCESWRSSKDRDFAAQRIATPDSFGYESVHYIVYNSVPLDLGSLVIPVETPCEVQIRTLLQHAESELTHSRVYKGKAVASQEVKRIVARCAALIETTDDLFLAVDDKMTKALSTHNDLLNQLRKAFLGFLPEVRNLYNEELDEYVFSKLEFLVKKLEIDLAKIDDFVGQKAFILDKLKTRSSWNILAAQPVSLLIYFLAAKAGSQLKETWNEILASDLLSPYFTDLGIVDGN